MIRPIPSRRPARRAVPLLALALALPACVPASRSRTLTLPGATDPKQVSGAYEDILAAQDAERRKKPDEAISLYRAGLQRYREFPAAWNNLGVLLMEDGRYIEAAECFSAAADLAPRDPRPTYNLGLTWDRAGYLEEALERYDLALERDDKYLPALRGAIRAEWLLGRGSQITLERLRVSLLLEQDASWREWMELQRLRLQSQLSGTGVSAAPPIELPSAR